MSKNYEILKQTVAKQREKIDLRRNGKRFSSLININASIDEQSKCDTIKAYLDFLNNGCDYFVSGKVFFDKDKKVWTPHKPRCADIYANVHIIDKIKVRSLFFSSSNVSRQFSMSGTKGINNRCNNNETGDMFLQEVSNSKDPMATWARYRTVENGLSLAVGPNDVSVNTINVNMARGVHEHILLLRAIACYHEHNNPSARVTPLIEHFKVNNSSATVDTGFSSVKNELSFIHDCVNSSGNNNFNILPKAEFKAHKLVTPCTENSFPTYHKETDMRKSIPIKGIEMQVHQRCLNCSAVSGMHLLQLVQQIIVDLLNHAYSGHVSIDICLLNAKALCEKLSNSLIIPCLNDFCEILCRKLGTYRMTLSEQMKTYNEQVAPILRKIFMSRDNYATSGTFATLSPQGSKLLSTNDSGIISHKYRSEETKELFKSISAEEMTPHLRNFIDKVNLYKTSKYSKNCKQSRNNQSYLRKKKKRTGGIIYNAAFCQKRYIKGFQKYNIPLPTSDEV